MMRSRTLAAIAILSLVVTNTNAQTRPTGANPAPAELARVVIDPSRVAVTGISSGGFMATQLQLAYPELFPRAAVLAGGPYDCAVIAGSMGKCLYPATLNAQQIETAVDNAIRKSKAGSLGDLSKLAKGIVYVLYGTEDIVVGAGIAGAVTKFYKTLKQKDAALAGLTVTEDGTRKFAHTFPTYLAPPPEDCDKSVSPYLGHCRFDGALDILQHLYPDVTTGNEPSKQDGTFMKLVSDRFRSTKTAFIGPNTYLYQPKVCRDGNPCGMLLVLHGCNQNEAAVGQTFARNVGFNRWADDYRLVIVYPQTRTADENYGCWDWWGYTGQQFDTREAPQMAWLQNLIVRLTGQSAPAEAPKR